MLWLYILVLFGACFLLIKSGTWVVKSLIRISQTLQWSEFLVTFFLMALATSLPELFVGLSSAFHKLPQLSFGNIIGANILNLTVGIAIAVLVAGGLRVESETTRSNSVYAAALSFLPLLLMLDGAVSRVDGIVLLLGLSIYLRKVLSQKERFSKAFIENFRKDRLQFKLFLKDLGTFFGSIFLLIFSAEGVVRTANFLALEINLPLITTGIIFVSLGTVLPEIVFGIKAVTLGHKEMVLGNFMGTVVVNSTLILGLVSLISPLIIINISPYLSGILFTFLSALGFVIFSSSDRKITKKEAIILIAIYILFIASQILLTENLIF